MSFYKWLRSRNVFCGVDFPIRLDVLEDLVTVLDMEYYCPVLRSIDITRWDYEHSSVNNHVKSNLSVFLSHCRNLQGVTVSMSDVTTRDVVLPVLMEKLRDDSLVKISLRNIQRQHSSNVILKDLITKHASSLRSLRISSMYEVDMDYIVCTLIENQIYLRELAIIMVGEPSQAMTSLISYISSSGGLLEDLKVGNVHVSLNAEDLVVSVVTSCPKLTCLRAYDCEPCSIETLRRLYEQCPHLQDVSIGNISELIKTDGKRKSMSIEVKGHSEDWAICLSHALRRGKYKKVTFLLREDYNHRVRSLKSMLKPYKIHIKAFTRESSFISLLQDLPHLNSLELAPNVNSQYSDATLAAISEHANSLTELTLKNIKFTDMSLSELIKTCQLLERLIIDNCGWESLVAISNHSNLNMVNITMCDSVSEEMLDGLLLDEKVTWPSTLEDGYILAFGYRISCKFDNKSHQWI
eukprot:scaffold5931_cov173-Ochromonas_danica.AAC.1